MGAESHNSPGAFTTPAQQAAEDAEDRLPERQAVERETLKGLEGASRDLKQRIADEKRRHDMPINASLGDPAIDARNADGRNDLPDDDDA